jgi:Plasmid stabilisation system protein.
MARKTIAEICKRFESLEIFPLMRTELAKLVSFDIEYRFIVHGNYIIIYQIEGEFVSIYRVLNRNQNFHSIIFRDDV